MIINVLEVVTVNLMYVTVFIAPIMIYFEHHIQNNYDQSLTTQLGT